MVRFQDKVGPINQLTKTTAIKAGEAVSLYGHNAWVPLTIASYRSFWIAGLFSNIGTWMHETGAQWLMASLDSSPSMVAGVRTAMTIPIFLLALPAGVCADRFDRRTWLIGSQSLLFLVAATMAMFALLGWITPAFLLVLTVCMGVAVTLNQPAWQALTPELVPPALVPSAVAAGSVSFNIARSLGPALGGLIIAQFGVWAAFSFNAVSFLGVILVLLWWRPELGEEEATDKQSFVAELLQGAMIVRQSKELRNVLMRVFLFLLSSSILWSVLALVAKDKLACSEKGFGVSVGTIGLGAVVGAWIMPLARKRLSSESTILMYSVLLAGALGGIGLSHTWLVNLGMLFIAGACWMSVLTTLNATAQIKLPRRLRARGMATYLMAFSLGMGLGSFFWGFFAGRVGLDVAFVTASFTLALSALGAHGLKIGSLRHAIT
jgi:predicted MFS family arabinose efflux permease